MPVFSGTADIELALLSQLGFPPPSKHTDGTRPHYFWVSPGGADGAGNGSYKEPYLTIRRAIRECVDGRGDVIIVSPGRYRESLDIGSGSTARGATDGYAKRDLKLIGAGPVHPGRIQIVSDGTSATPTIRVRDGYLRGFVLASLEVGSTDSSDADRAQPLVDLETNDDGTLTALSDDYWAMLKNVRLASGGGATTATLGLVLTGTTMLEVDGLHVQGITRGISFRGSLNNFPDHCFFRNCRFMDNVTFDVGTLRSPAQGLWGDPLTGGLDLTNILFDNCQFMDRGGTPVTNYIDMGNAGTHVNVLFSDCWFARDVAEGTLLNLAVDDIVLGQDAAGSVNVIGT